MSEPLYAFYTERRLRNGVRCRIEILPSAYSGASSGVYSEFVELPAECIDEEVIIKAGGDENIPIGLVDEKVATVKFNIGFLNAFIENETDTTYKLKLEYLRDAILEPELIVPIINVINNKTIRNKKVANTWNIYFRSVDIYSAYENDIYYPFNDITLLLSDIPITEIFTLDGIDFVLKNSKPAGFESKYYIVAERFDKTELTEAEIDGIQTSLGVGELIYHQFWHLEFSGCQKINLEYTENFSLFNQELNFININLGDSFVYAMEQISWNDIEITEEVKSNTFIKDLQFAKFSKYDYQMSDIDEYFEDFDIGSLIAVENQLQFVHFKNKLLTPYMIKLDHAYDLIIEHIYKFWSKYLMHEHWTLNYSFFSPLVKHPFWFFNFFSHYNLRGIDIGYEIDVASLVWEYTIPDPEEPTQKLFTRKSKENTGNYIISRIKNEFGELKGGFFSDINGGLGDTYKTLYDFFKDSCESAAVLGYFSFKNGLPIGAKYGWTGSETDTKLAFYGGYFPIFNMSVLSRKEDKENFDIKTDWNEIKIFNNSYNKDNLIKDLVYNNNVDYLKSVKTTALLYGSGDKINNIEVNKPLSIGNTEFNIKDFVWNNVSNSDIQTQESIERIYGFVSRDGIIQIHIQDDKITPNNFGYRGSEKHNCRKIYFEEYTSAQVGYFSIVDPSVNLHIYPGLHTDINPNFLNKYDVYKPQLFRFYIDSDMKTMSAFYDNSIEDYYDSFKNTIWWWDETEYIKYPNLKYYSHFIDESNGNKGYIDFWPTSTTTAAYFNGLAVLYDSTDTAIIFTADRIQALDRVNMLGFDIKQMKLDILNGFTPTDKRAELLKKSITEYQERNSIQKTVASVILDSFSRQNKVAEFEIEWNLKRRLSYMGPRNQIISTQMVGAYGATTPLDDPTYSPNMLIHTEMNLKTGLQKVKQFSNKK